MPPVTIKNDKLIPTLFWVQMVLFCLSVLVIIMSLYFQLQSMLLLLLLTGVFYYRNQHVVQRHKVFDVVMNEQNQWHLIHNDTKQVVEAQLDSWWKTPLMIAVKLSANQAEYWYMIARHKVGPAHFSRLIVGLENND